MFATTGPAEADHLNPAGGVENGIVPSVLCQIDPRGPEHFRGRLGPAGRKKHKEEQMSTHGPSSLSKVNIRLMCGRRDIGRSNDAKSHNGQGSKARQQQKP
jgi:hypothetical protein